MQPRTGGPPPGRRQDPPPTGLDATWTGLTGRAIDLFWPNLGLEARVEIETAHALVALASPPDTSAVAVEPQTHGPDPMRRLERGEPDAPAMLPPGAELPMTVTLTANLAGDGQTP